MDEFPSNSQSPKKPNPKKEKKEVESVVTGEVIQKKKSLGRRFKDVFLGADFKEASSYIVADVLFPAVRNLVVDATTKGIERFVYGETVSQRSRHGRPNTNYRESSNRRPSIGRSNRPSSRQESRPNSDSVVIVSREEADMVLDEMMSMIEKYEAVSVADYRDLCGLPSAFVDNKWGWTDLSYAETHQVREGYLIDLPTPVPIS